jgi:hypothetical protein
MLILLSQNEQGISQSALDLQKHIFPLGCSPMKSMFASSYTSITAIELNSKSTFENFFFINIFKKYIFIL